MVVALSVSLTDLGDYVVAAALAIPVIAAGIGLLSGARRLLVRTIGRRRDAYRRLGRLGTGARLVYFETMLGEPPAIKQSIEAEMPDYGAEIDHDETADSWEWPLVTRIFTECFFVDRDFYVQTISDSDETVLAYSVTTRSRRFKPHFKGQPALGWKARRRWKKETGEKYVPYFDLRLGRTSFADSSDFNNGARKIKPVWGAHDYWYSEIYSYGNPSYYQAFVLTASNAAGDFNVDFEHMTDDLRELLASDDPDERLESAEEHDLARFRAETIVTTYTVIGGKLPEDHFPSTFGPNWNVVRTIP